MTEHEIIRMLREAALCLDRNDADGFGHILNTARACGTANESLQGEMLLLSVAGGEIAGDDILETLRQAERMIGGRSRILTPESGFAENHYDALMLYGRTPGRADAISGKSGDIQRITEVYQRLTGFGVGITECFQAQLAYARGDFERALKYAGTELPAKAADGKTGLIRVYMLEVIAGVAKHTMDQRLWRGSYGELRELASGERPASRSCREQAEVVCAMLDMSLGCLQDVPVWLRTGDFGVIPAPHGYEIIGDRLLTGTLPGAMTAHMEYLSYSGEPIRALQTADLIQRVFDVHSVVLDAYAAFLKAGAYLNLNRPTYARRAIREGMEMVAADGLWLIAAEFVPIFGEEIYAAAREYDGSMPEKIRRIGEGFYDKLAPLRNDMLRGTAEGLTKRERQVADLVTKGYSNAEISQIMNVSVRTVKYHLGNVYQKLNITRRSKLAGEAGQEGSARLADWVK